MKDPVEPIKRKKSFLGDNVYDDFGEQKLYSVRIVEKVNRDQFLLALTKIMQLLPLISHEEYSYRFRSEQAISYLQIETLLKTSPLINLSWDQIIDILLNINF